MPYLAGSTSPASFITAARVWSASRKPSDSSSFSRVVQGKGVLLFDDLFRSGATMNAITAALYDEGGAGNVFALTITRTRSHR